MVGVDSGVVFSKVAVVSSVVTVKCAICTVGAGGFVESCSSSGFRGFSEQRGGVYVDFGFVVAYVVKVDKVCVLVGALLWGLL